VLVALILMAVIAGGAGSVWLKDKESYGTDVMDLRTYFGVEEGKLAIFEQNEKLAEKAVLKDGTCYLNYNYVKTTLNKNFYYDMAEKKLLFTDALGSFVATPGEDKYLQYGEEKSMGFQPCYQDNEGLFVALPYVALFTDLEYRVNDYRLQFITSFDPYDATVAKKETKMRVQGDPKSEILCDVAQGETLAVLDSVKDWTCVRNEEGVTGYVEDKFLGETYSLVPEKSEEPKTYVKPEYTSIKLYEKVCLGWHAIGGVGGNATLEEMLGTSVGMNVISPTWFSLNDNEGGFRNFGEASYVKKAHKYGLEVWGAFDDFNYENETGENIDDTVILSSTEKRTKLIANMIDVTLELGMDGINLDFEKVGTDCREHFGQFLRELSAECRKNSIKLSVDNYVPNEGNKQYRLDVQGEVADYVILMGYDEHWHGSGNPGSVSSIGFISDGITKALQSVPADKLVNAVPLYTIQWQVMDGGTVKDDYLTYVNQASLVAKVGRGTTWDDETCQNYVEWSSNGSTYKVWLEDLDSLSMKLNVMSANDLAGVAAWRLGYGTQEVWNLLSAFKQM